MGAAPRQRLPMLAAVAAAGWVTAIPASAQSAATPPSSPAGKAGYWWYQAPPPKVEPTTPEKPDPDALKKPVIPPMRVLASFTPPKIKRLIEEQRDYAATVLTVDAVADFWKLEDFARRKARAFAGVTQIAMLSHPELNPRGAYPLVGDARSAMTEAKDDVRKRYLHSVSNEFALVMFSRSSCNYCRVQWPILQRFQEEYGMSVTMVDIDQRPDAGQRFGVEVTPTTMLIRRNSPQHMTIAAGIEAYPTIAQMTYQAVKLLRGDVRPEQFMTGAGEEGGFFDALSNGPVASTDPSVLGGDLVTAQAGVPRR